MQSGRRSAFRISRPGFKCLFLFCFVASYFNYSFLIYETVISYTMYKCFKIHHDIWKGPGQGWAYGRYSTNKCYLPSFPRADPSVIHGLKNVTSISTRPQTCLFASSQALPGLLQVQHNRSHSASYAVTSLTTISQNESHSHTTHLCRPCS